MMHGKLKVFLNSKGPFSEQKKNLSSITYIPIYRHEKRKLDDPTKGLRIFRELSSDSRIPFEVLHPNSVDEFASPKGSLQPRVPHFHPSLPIFPLCKSSDPNLFPFRPIISRLGKISDRVGEARIEFALVIEDLFIHMNAHNFSNK